MTPLLPEDEALRKLEEDLGGEPAALQPLARRLAAWEAPQPAPDEAARLLARLRAEMPAKRRPSVPGLALAGLLLRAQLRVIRDELWLGSALILMLGVAVSLGLAQPGSAAESLPFVLLAPVVAAAGVAFLYGPAVDPALEVELATPVPPTAVLLARLLLLVGFDLGLSLAGSLILAVLRADLSLWPLILAWLAPMAFLSALALLLTAVFRDPLIGVTVSLILWGLQVLRHITGGAGLIGVFLPDLQSAAARLVLLGLAGLMTLTALWMVGREERWVRPAG